MNIYGFVGKPETAKKTRGDQYFFVNNRFIKSAYLNHAVMNAYQEMIADDSFPMYVLFIDLDPTQVDINVHPTKQEIKFEDEKIVYAFVQAAVNMHWRNSALHLHWILNWMLPSNNCLPYNNHLRKKKNRQPLPLQSLKALHKNTRRILLSRKEKQN